MRTGRPKVHQVTLSESQREQLEAFSRSRSLPHGLRRRATVVLHAGEGMPSTMIAERLGMTETTVRKWCKRFIDEGMDGLYGLPGAGRPRTYGDDEVARTFLRNWISTWSWTTTRRINIQRYALGLLSVLDSMFISHRRIRHG